MSNCLTDWIGIYGCDAPSGAFSGVYINQLPGVNLDSIESVADDEQKTYLGVWSDVQERGIRKFYNRVTTELSKRYRLKSLKSTNDLGTIIDKTPILPINQYRGFTYELKLKNQLRRSNYQALNVQKLRLYLLQAGNVTLKIVDLDTATVLWTKQIIGVSGWNIIEVNEKFTNQRLFFGYDDANTIQAVSLPINNYNADWFNTMFYSIYGYGYSVAMLRGAITNDKTQFNQETQVLYTQSDDTYGLSAIFSLVCVYDFLICDNKDLFTNALWYLLGAELAIEVQFSNRLNRYTTIDIEKAKELETYFMSEFENELAIVLDGVSISTSDCCIECNTQIQQMQSVL